jgi:hypothetical protein
MNKNSVNSLPDGWEIRIAENSDEIEAIRPAWEYLQSREPFSLIDTDIDRYLSIIESMEGKAQPYVIVLSYEGKPSVMVIARIQILEHVIKVGYKTLFKPKLKTLVVVYGGILGQPDSDICTFIMQILIKLLRSREVNMIYFSYLKKDSHIYELSRKMPSVFTRNYFPVVDLHWQTSISNTTEEFGWILSKKRKREIYRCIRNLESKCSGPLNVMCYHQKDNIQEFLKIASQISDLTYQKGMGQGLNENSFMLKLLNQAQDKQWLRAYVLFAGIEPVAFEYGCVYRDLYFAEQAGFNPAYSAYSPGTILQLKIFEHLGQVDGVTKYDFGFGDAVYKRRFGNYSWSEVSAYIFAPYFYPIIINMLDSSIKAISFVLSNIIHKLGFTEKIKKWWRLRLQYSQADK